MKNKQNVAEILSFISLSILILLFFAFLTAPDESKDYSKLGILVISPLPLTLSLILTIKALFLNKKQLLGWLILLFILMLLSFAIFIILDLKNLPFGVGTN